MKDYPRIYDFSLYQNEKFKIGIRFTFPPQIIEKKYDPIKYRNFTLLSIDMETNKYSKYFDICIMLFNRSFNFTIWRKK